MFQLEDKEIIKLEKKLRELKKKSIPFATKKTLNDSAFQTQKIARADIKKNMIIRNKFTINSIRVNLTKSLNIKNQMSEIGSIASYMEDQEFGGTKKPKSGHNLSIATSFAAGQDGQQVRTKLPTRANSLKNIQLKRNKINAFSKKQRNFLLIRQATKQANKYVFLDFNKNKGIFKVKGKKDKAKIKMVYDMSNKTITIKKKPWLNPAVKETIKMIPAFYADALRFQLRRVGWLK